MFSANLRQTEETCHVNYAPAAATDGTPSVLEQIIPKIHYDCDSDGGIVYYNLSGNS